MKCITLLQDENLALQVYVQPRASRNRIAGIHGNAVKVCVTAPPVENKANEAVVHFFADLFGVRREVLDKWINPGRYISGREFAEAGLAELVNLLGRRSAKSNGSTNGQGNAKPAAATPSKQLA